MRAWALAAYALMLAAPAAAAQGNPFPLGVAVDAVVAQILVANGAHVGAGQPLVKMDCRPREARVAARAAHLAAKEAAYARAKNGSRPEEIAIGAANVNLAQARSEEAADAFARARALTEGVTVTRAQLLEVKRDARMAAAQLNDAQKRLALLQAGSRQEDIDEAKAVRDAAAARLDVAKALLDRCTVVAPVAGTVEILAAPGQLFSLTAPAPVARLTPGRQIKSRRQRSLFSLRVERRAGGSHAESRRRKNAPHSASCIARAASCCPTPGTSAARGCCSISAFPRLPPPAAATPGPTGRPDYGVTRADVLEHLTALCVAVDLPVNADYESGFGDDPDGVAESVRLATQAGVAGLSIEDRAAAGFYDTASAVERLRAALAGAGEALVVARTEILLDDPDQVSTAIDKLVAFAAAGADCLYAPGVRKPADIRAMVAAVSPKPVNVLAMDPAVPSQAYADLGVRRVSVGGALARVGWGAVAETAKAMREGSFAGLAKGMPGRELNAAFAPRG